MPVSDWPLRRGVGHRETCRLAGKEGQWEGWGAAFESDACTAAPGRVCGVPRSSRAPAGNATPVPRILATLYPDPRPRHASGVAECLRVSRSDAGSSVRAWRLGRRCLSLRGSFHRRQPGALLLRWRLRSRVWAQGVCRHQREAPDSGRGPG